MLSAAAAARPGLTIPLPGMTLADHANLIADAGSLGYQDVWASETTGVDAFTPLVLSSQWAPDLGLGTSIVPVYTRGPATLAVTAAGLAGLAPGRFRLGIGTSSSVIIENWNSIPFDRPYQRSRDTLRFLRDAFSGEKVDRDYETFGVHGFRLERPSSPAPSVLLAALRPQMLRLAGREADGVILNWLSPEDVKVVRAEFEQGVAASGHGGQQKEIMAHVFVCPNEDTERVRADAKRYLAGYLHVPVYAAFHTWLGRGELLADMWAAWSSGDRAGAVKAIPDQVVDDLVIHGSVASCQKRLREYVAAGVTCPALTVLPFGVDAEDVARELAPASWIETAGASVASGGAGQ